MFDDMFEKEGLIRHRVEVNPGSIRAQPQPRFVGGSTGLMVAVLTLCGLLLVAGVWLSVRLAEQAWHWWTTPYGAEALTPLPHNEVPPADTALANRSATGNPGAAFSAESYPIEALRARESGRVVARLHLDKAGNPFACAVTTSSGSKSLDQQTCRIAVTRVRYQPARDDRGRPISSYVNLPVRWELPK